MPTVKKSILMTDPDVAADKEIADLDAHLIKLAELRAATLAEMKQLCAGSLPHIAHKVEVEAIDRSIRRLQGAKAMWGAGKDDPPDGHCTSLSVTSLSARFLSRREWRRMA
jgi:hypothetical protein